jgi:hypothetical protein
MGAAVLDTGEVKVLDPLEQERKARKGLITAELPGEPEFTLTEEEFQTPIGRDVARAAGRRSDIAMGLGALRERLERPPGGTVETEQGAMPVAGYLRQREMERAERLLTETGQAQVLTPGFGELGRKLVRGRSVAGDPGARLAGPRLTRQERDAFQTEIRPLLAGIAEQKRLIAGDMATERRMRQAGDTAKADAAAKRVADGRAELSSLEAGTTRATQKWGLRGMQRTGVPPAGVRPDIDTYRGLYAAARSEAERRVELGGSWRDAVAGFDPYDFLSPEQLTRRNVKAAVGQIVYIQRAVQQGKARPERAYREMNKLLRPLVKGEVTEKIMEQREAGYKQGVVRIKEFINDLQSEKKALASEQNKLATDLRAAKAAFAEARRMTPDDKATKEQIGDITADVRKEMTRIQNQYDKAGRQIGRIDVQIKGYESRRDEMERGQFGEAAVTRTPQEAGKAQGLIEKAEASDDPAAIIRGGMGGLSEDDLKALREYLLSKGIKRL